MMLVIYKIMSKKIIGFSKLSKQEKIEWICSNYLGNSKEDLEILDKYLNNDINIQSIHDTFSENIYLISKHNIYTRVIKQHYRFPNEKLVASIKNKNSNIPIGADRIISIQKVFCVVFGSGFINSVELLSEHVADGSQRIQ